MNGEPSEIAALAALLATVGPVDSRPPPAPVR